MTHPNCMAKNFDVIKDSQPLKNESIRIKQIFDAEYK